VRGLRCGEEVITEALVCQKKIRALLEDKMFKIIARWIKKSKKDGKFGQACMLHAHLAFIHRNVEVENLSPRVVFTILASQIFLFNYYKYDLDMDQKEGVTKKSRTDVEDIKGDLGVPQVELFDMFQRCRRMIFTWLVNNANDRNQVMDGIVQMVEEGQRKHVPKESICAHFNWVTIEQAGMNFKGRFVPDIEYDEERFISNLSKVSQHSFEEWLRETTTLSVNTEINVQLGEFTVKKNITKPLEDVMTEKEEFNAAFSSLKINDIIQCADVKNTTNRKWVRLVGLGYDLQLWSPDMRRPAPPVCTFILMYVLIDFSIYICDMFIHVYIYIHLCKYIIFQISVAHSRY
jgi:hypothetical protein